jgi:hypothetical protein
MMETLGAVFWWLVSLLAAALWWLAGTVLWMAFWVALPLLLVAYLAMRAAEAALGKAVVRGWLTARAAALGGGIWFRISRAIAALSAMPFRVLFWFLVYAVWHSFVSLLWRPRWGPWQRAWQRRWRPAKTVEARTGKTPTGGKRDATAKAR